MDISVISSSLYPCTPVSYHESLEYLNFVLCEQLAKQGHEVHLFAPAKSKLPEGCQLHYIPTSSPTLSREVEDFVFTFGPYRDIALSCDVVIDNSALRQVAERLHYWEGDRVKHVSIYNTVDFSSPRSNARHNCIVASSGMITAGIFGQEITYNCPFPELGGSNPNGNETIPNTTKVLHLGVDLSKYQSNGKKSDTVLYMSSLHPLEGIGSIINLAKVYTDRPFLVVGTVDDSEEVQYAKSLSEICKQYGISNIDIVVGRLSQAERVNLLQKASVLVAPSNYIKGYSITALEALSCGTPIISTWWGCWPDIIQPGVNGFMCVTDRDFQLALHDIEQIDPKICRSVAEERFSLDIMGKNLEELLESALKGESW